MNLILRFDEIPPDLLSYFEPVEGGQLSDVWKIPTESYKQAHFATFPKKLVAPPILGGTSPYGVCGACGAQWTRVVEKTGHINKREPAHCPNNDPTKTDSTDWAPTTRATNKWQPSCSCNAEVVPAIVFDPFVGTGTTVEVAKQAGRRAIGMDLSEEYLALAMVRAEKKTPQAAIEDEELTLFAFAGLKG